MTIVVPNHLVAGCKLKKVRDVPLKDWAVPWSWPLIRFHLAKAKAGDEGRPHDRGTKGTLAQRSGRFTPIGPRKKCADSRSLRCSRPPRT